MIFVKEAKNVEDLCLTFSVSNADFGQAKEVDLVEDGRNVSVTGENKIRYIHLMANYKTNTQIYWQTAAFLSGLQCVIPSVWLKMFDPYELNVLISGSTAGFDVADLRRNTVYSGGYDEGSPIITWFWQLVGEIFSDEDRSKLLMFVSSCSRAPLLGFKSFYPKFCIHRVPDNERLPTASTCANLLKLPDYADPQRLRQKLTQAMQSESGFDLS